MSVESTVDRAVCSDCDSPYHRRCGQGAVSQRADRETCPPLADLLERMAVSVLRLRVRDVRALEAGMDVMTYLEVRAAESLLADLADRLPGGEGRA